MVLLVHYCNMKMAMKTVAADTGSSVSDNTIRKALRRAGYLTRDAREVERKKVGYT